MVCDKCRHHKRKSRCTTCNKCKAISPKDFGCAQNRSYHITEPGRYCLTKDITFYPPSAQELSAILIDSDDVTLDLCGHVLEQGNEVTFCIGVKVLTGHQNVTILGSNGAIRKFTQAGIYVEGGNKDIRIGGPTGTLDITETAYVGEYNRQNVYPPTGLQKLASRGAILVGETKFMAAIGFYDGVAKGPFENVTIQNVRAERNMGGQGIAFGNGKGLQILDSSISFNFETRKNGPLYGAEMRFRGESIVNESISYNGMYLKTPEGEVVVDDSLEDVIIRNCQVNNNHVNTLDSTVTEIFNDNVFIALPVATQVDAETYDPIDDPSLTFRNLVVEDSEFNGTTSTSPGLSDWVTGARGFVTAAGTNVTLNNCSFSGSTSIVDEAKGISPIEFLAPYASGFHVSGSNEVPVSLGGTGFDSAISSGYGYTLRECKAVNIQGKALNNESSGFTQVFGYENVFTQGFEMTNCLADSIIGEYDNLAVSNFTSFVDGLKITSDSGKKIVASEATITGCTFSKIFSNEPNDARRRIAGIITFRLLKNAVIKDSNFLNINGDPADYGYVRFGESVAEEENQVLENNVFQDVGTAIRLLRSNSNVVKSNVFNNTSTAIQLNGSECNSILANDISNSLFGVDDDTTLNLIAKNKTFNVPLAYPTYAVVASSVLPDLPDNNGKLCTNTDIAKSLVLNVNTLEAKALKAKKLENLEEELKWPDQIRDRRL